MSEIISSAVSKPSRIHNLSYIIFGYVLSSALISPKQIGSLADYLIVLTLTGGIIATFLFYVQPIESMLKAFTLPRMTVFGRQFHVGFFPFNSPFLVETKGKIVGGLFFFMACLITAFNPNLDSQFLLNPWLKYSIIAASIPVLIVSLNEARKLLGRLDIVALYYELAFLYQTERDMPNQPEVALEYNKARRDEHRRYLESFKSALEREDWVEGGVTQMAYRQHPWNADQPQ